MRYVALFFVAISCFGCAQDKINLLALRPLNDGDEKVVDVDAYTAKSRIKKAMTDLGFKIKKDQAVPGGGRMVIGCQQELPGLIAGSWRLELVRAVVMPLKTQARIIIMSESFGETPSWHSESLRFINEAADAPEQSDRRVAAWGESRRREKEDWDRWDALPAEERVHAKQWNNLVNTYMRNGYEYDEAAIIADRMTGGRPKRLPPEGR